MCRFYKCIIFDCLCKRMDIFGSHSITLWLQQTSAGTYAGLYLKCKHCTWQKRHCTLLCTGALKIFKLTLLKGPSLRLLSVPQYNASIEKEKSKLSFYCQYPHVSLHIIHRPWWLGGCFVLLGTVFLESVAVEITVLKLQHWSTALMLHAPKMKFLSCLL